MVSLYHKASPESLGLNLREWTSESEPLRVKIWEWTPKSEPLGVNLLEWTSRSEPLGVLGAKKLCKSCSNFTDIASLLVMNTSVLWHLIFTRILFAPKRAGKRTNITAFAVDKFIRLLKIHKLTYSGKCCLWILILTSNINASRTTCCAICLTVTRTYYKI